MRKYIIFYTVLLISCSMSGSKSTEVTFHIPDMPEEMQCLEISYYKVTVTTVDSREIFTARDQNFKASVPVSGITAVTAAPVGTWGTLKPAGFIVHGNLKAHNSLSWDNGFAAECTELSLITGSSSSNFNFTMFQNKLLEKSEGNPWTLNQDKVVYGLRFDKFNSNSIRNASSHTLCLPLPGEGTWYAGTPGCIKKYEQHDGYIWDLDITEGENIFINPAAGTGISIYADQLTWVCISGTTGGLSGYW